MYNAANKLPMVISPQPEVQEVMPLLLFFVDTTQLLIKGMHAHKMNVLKDKVISIKLKLSKIPQDTLHLYASF